MDSLQTTVYANGNPYFFLKEGQEFLSMDDLKHKLLYTTLELQKMKMKANVRLREQKDTVQHLLNLFSKCLQGKRWSKRSATGTAFQVNVFWIISFLFKNSTTGQKFTGLVSPGGNSVENDRGIAVIDYLAQGKVLPQKGKLLQAVMDAGPLLQSLLITGQLPQWRNPPSP
ncbi:hypothetical protein OIU77_012980 [Salix suchowensis]|uniref:Uncharacterized protein n=1 Tax=Salix suchowensis TaxID=1278906 RepID=A0ABQ9A6R5_9ROSI|nr:hypothetical protein OIU77_012980 [Salix suchowensis]